MGAGTGHVLKMWTFSRDWPEPVPIFSQAAGRHRRQVMSNEMMDLEQLATYLHRDLREVTKLASRGYLPGQKVAGQWRFARAEINHWIETQMHAYTEQQLTVLETVGTEPAGQEPLITSLLGKSSVARPLVAHTHASVL